MRILRLTLRLWRLVTIVLPLISLSGCIVSENSLISVDEAVFPFEALTYKNHGGADSNTIVRTPDGYTVVEGSYPARDFSGVTDSHSSV